MGFKATVGFKAAVETYWSHLLRLLIFAQTGSSWEGKYCQDILQAEPWLEGFRASKGDPDAALGVLAGCIFDLIKLDHAPSNAIVLAAWKFCAIDRLEQFDRQRKVVRLDEVKVTYLLKMIGGDKFNRFNGDFVGARSHGHFSGGLAYRVKQVNTNHNSSYYYLVFANLTTPLPSSRRLSARCYNNQDSLTSSY